jgi:hypothetical protein
LDKISGKALKLLISLLILIHHTQLTTNMFRTFKKIEESAIHPSEVAKTILDVATSEDPQLRYGVGNDTAKTFEARKNMSDRELTCLSLNDTIAFWIFWILSWVSDQGRYQEGSSYLNPANPAHSDHSLGAQLECHLAFQYSDKGGISTTSKAKARFAIRFKEN